MRSAARCSSQKIAAANLGSAPPPGFTTTLGGDAYQHQDLGSYAAFGQGTFRPDGSLRLIGGARLTYDQVKMRY
jgi:outer membrane receptor protein involved in Fe transport